MLQPGCNDPQRVTTLLDQAASQSAGLVAQFVDCQQNTLTCLRGDIGTVVNYSGNRLSGDTSDLCDLFDGGAPVGIHERNATFCGTFVIVIGNDNMIANLQLFVKYENGI